MIQQLCISESRSRRHISQRNTTDGRPRNPMKNVFKRNSLLAEGRSDSKHIWTTSSTPQECRTQPVKEKCARCDHTDSRHNVQGIRSRQDYPVNRQPRRFMSNRSLQKQKVKDSHDTSNS
ncbi:hypothetical protein B9Z55_024871 [Caenorhabditis nigoni]|uniref:Uncharacterized protein n=1 Tax=Caenorhabditis nigoni TaxID=1611254 RepID=A0A2G5SWH4_9PELO|nr:hypothetical protein B9Z55_024871 [Caenorhabditis nigoni]